MSPAKLLTPAQVKSLREAMGLCQTCRQRIDFLDQAGVDVSELRKMIDATERRTVGALTVFEQQQSQGPMS